MKHLLKIFFVFFILSNISSVEAQQRNNRKTHGLYSFLIDNGVSEAKIPMVQKEIRTSMRKSCANDEAFVMDTQLKSYLSKEAGLSDAKIDLLSTKIATKCRMHQSNFRGHKQGRQGKGFNNKGGRMYLFLKDNGVSEAKIPMVQKEIRTSMRKSFASDEAFVMDTQLKSYLSKEAGLSDAKIDLLSTKIATKCRMHQSNFRGHKQGRQGKGFNNKGGRMYLFLKDNGVSEAKIPMVQKEIRTSMRKSCASDEAFVMDAQLKSYLSKEAGLSDAKIDLLSDKLKSHCNRRFNKCPKRK